MPSTSQKRTVCILIFDEVEVLDFCGPFESPEPSVSMAASVGFKSGDAFSRAFERRFGVKPSSYRKHFSFKGKPDLR